MNAEKLIQRANEAANKLYHEGNSLEKMFFHRGYLESTIRELCVYLENANAEIRTLQAELRNLND